MVRDLHEAGHRGDPRRGLQPHRRGQPPRARRCRSAGIDNASYYRLVDGQPAVLHGLHRHRQHAQRPAPAHAAADHGLAALLGAGDARRRFPLRPGRDAGPRVLRRGPAVGVLRPGPAGPDGLARSSSSPSRGTSAPAATRWATSRRSGQSGTASTGTPSATSGAASRRRSASSPARHHRLPRPVRAQRPAPGRAASTSSPRTTGSRCATSSRTTRSTTRPTAKATRTASRTTAPGTAGSRARPTTSRSSSCGRSSGATSWRTLFLSQGVPMLLHGDETGPHPARQQQRLLPGQRHHLAGLDAGGRGPRPVHRPAVRSCAGSTRCSGGGGSSTAGRCGAATAPGCRTSPGSPRRPGR